jgi:hypothetical protein
MKPWEELGDGLRAIPGVAETRSRFGPGQNPAWCIDGREFAHLHSNSRLDLRLPRAIQARLRGDPRAHFRHRASAWVELEFHGSQDVADLLTLAGEAVATVAK